MNRIADFLFEVAMLQRTQRTGFRFLGTGEQSVAEHILLTTYIGYVLAKMGAVSVNKVLYLCLFHDLPEVRTGDLSHLYRQYVQTNAKAAVEHATADLPFADQIRGLVAEFKDGETKEAKLARDADKLEFILQLKRMSELGNPHAAEWIEYSVSKLRTPEGIELARALLETNSTKWWLRQFDVDES